MRKNDRQNNELRPVSIEKGFYPNADGSLLIKMGDTHVACAASVEESVPRFLMDSDQGWITAEYGMLPWSTNTRSQREAARGRSGRTYEVQRLIGRSLRMMVDLDSRATRELGVKWGVLDARPPEVNVAGDFGVTPPDLVLQNGGGIRNDTVIPDASSASTECRCTARAPTCGTVRARVCTSSLRRRRAATMVGSGWRPGSCTRTTSSGSRRRPAGRCRGAR